MPVITIPYAPRAAFLPFHRRTQRWGMLVVHRRGGKTVAVINDLIKRALECVKPSPRFAYIAPTYTQAKDVAWGYLKRYAMCIPGAVASESELWVTLPGDRRIRLYGSDNYERLRGIYLHGCAIDESADMAPAAWTEVLSPALADQQGWCVWIGTPKGRDSFYKLWRDACSNADWFTMILPASVSGLLPVDELESQRQRMTEAQYAQEFECSFDLPAAGAIYAQEVDKARAGGRVTDTVLHHSTLPVYSVFDIGAPLNTVCWLFQSVGDRLNFIECLRGGDDCKTPAQWAAVLRAKSYNYGAHFIPHDGETLWRNLLQDAGLQYVVVLDRPINVWDNINDSVDAFGRCWFNAAACKHGLESLESYRSREERDGVSVTNVPVHDWASHASTAFGYAHQAIRSGKLIDRSTIKRNGLSGVKVLRGAGPQSYPVKQQIGGTGGAGRPMVRR